MWPWRSQAGRAARALQTTTSHVQTTAPSIGTVGGTAGIVEGSPGTDPNSIEAAKRSACDCEAEIDPVRWAHAQVVRTRDRCGLLVVADGERNRRSLQQRTIYKSR